MITSRFKRVEAQVVQNDQETTYSIFKKLNFLKWYFVFFMVSLLAFKIPLMIKYYESVQEYEENAAN